jgi:hypothetical protein
VSLWEDGPLDIADEHAAERWRDFHEAQLPVQTEPLADGREVSPHDPLLPVLLAVPVGLGGWAGAKVLLALVGGALAASLTWTAHRRFAVPLPTAAVVVSSFAIVTPFAAYGAQVYPELPAALAVTVAVAVLTGPMSGRGTLVAFGAAVVALPWLAVKYVPVAAALAVIALWQLRSRRRDAYALAGGLALMGVAYVVAHRVLYGGWTVYAAGDHFVGGEHTAVGHHPDLPGRSRRLVGLLVDRHFGLLSWAPGWALAVPAVGLLARRRPTGWLALALPLAAGWATATWVALTMHGWWWPGRQVVVVLPLAVLAVAWWASSAARVVVPAAAVLALAGGALWWPYLLDVSRHPFAVGLVIDLERTNAWRWLLPEMRTPTSGDWVRYVAWLAAGALAVLIPRTRKALSCPEGSVPLPSAPSSSSPASRPAVTTTAAPSAT